MHQTPTPAFVFAARGRRWLTHASLLLAALMLGACATVPLDQPSPPATAAAPAPSALPSDSATATPVAPPVTVAVPRSAQNSQTAQPAPAARSNPAPAAPLPAARRVESAPSSVALATPAAAPAAIAQPVAPQTDLQAAPPLAGERMQTVAPLEAPRELWDRIRRGFSMPDLQNELVGTHERWYASRPEYIQRMTERSRRYLFHIVEELERRNMPLELALLPFIESAFNPQAVSSAKAAGMWQFMPATGRDFELKQNVFRDDRRDVLASTRAALDYLQRLHQMFGDWHLALAAYNWGEGNVGRAIARNKRAGLGTSYTDLNMPAETRNYVPKLQAVKNIVAAPESFSAELPLIENHPYFQEVEITRDIDVTLAARLADVKLEDFKALNPSANRPVILAAGRGRILLPWENAEIFKRNFEAHNAGRYASWTAWTVPSTMSVAEAAKRMGMSESELRALNQIPPRMLIKAGSALLVPRTAKMNQDVSSHVADNGSLGLAPEVIKRRTTVKAHKGDTVASIAKRFKVSTSAVAEWNQVATSASFKAGQAVVVYLPVRTAKASKPTPPKREVARKAIPSKPARQVALQQR
jgi:membrane-bound lytic murein transglycosylase D